MINPEHLIHLFMYGLPAALNGVANFNRNKILKEQEKFRDKQLTWDKEKFEKTIEAGDKRQIWRMLFEMKQKQENQAFQTSIFTAKTILEQERHDSSKAHQLYLKYLDAQLSGKIRSGEPIIKDGILSLYPLVNEPIIIFNTKLNTDERRLPNPMLFLYEEFNNLSKKLENNILIKDYMTSINSDIDAANFYNNEFAGKSAIIVYGKYTQNHFYLKMTYGGITNDLVMFDRNYQPVVIPFETKEVTITKFSISEIVAIHKKNSHLSPREREEHIDKVLSTYTNLTLQFMIDEYHSWFFDKEYTPKALDVLNQNLPLLKKYAIDATQLNQTLNQHKISIQNYKTHLMEINNEYEELHKKFNQSYLDFLTLEREIKENKNIKDKKLPNINAIKEKIERMANKEYKVAIVGKANAGKSTFINALLEDEILPSSALQCTSSIIEVKHHDRIKIEVDYCGKNDKVSFLNLTVDELKSKLKEIGSISEAASKINEIDGLSIKDVHDFMVEIRKNNQEVTLKKVSKHFEPIIKENKSKNKMPFPMNNLKKVYKRILDYSCNERNYQQIVEKITVYYPTPQSIQKVFSNVVITDTPGLGATIAYAKKTLQYIQRADAIFFIQSGRHVEEEALRTFVNKYFVHKRDAKKSFLVITRRAELLKKEKGSEKTVAELSFDKAKELYKEYIPKDHIFMVDSLVQLFYPQIKSIKIGKKFIRRKDIDFQCISSDILEFEAQQEELEEYREETGNLNYGQDITEEQLKLHFAEVAGFKPFIETIKQFSEKAAVLQLEVVNNEIIGSLNRLSYLVQKSINTIQVTETKGKEKALENYEEKKTEAANLTKKLSTEQEEILPQDKRSIETNINAIIKEQEELLENVYSVEQIEGILLNTNKKVENWYYRFCRKLQIKAEKRLEDFFVDLYINNSSFVSYDKSINEGASLLNRLNQAYLEAKSNQKNNRSRGIAAGLLGVGAVALTIATGGTILPVLLGGAATGMGTVSTIEATEDLDELEENHIKDLRKYSVKILYDYKNGVINHLQYEIENYYTQIYTKIQNQINDYNNQMEHTMNSLSDNTVSYKDKIENLEGFNALVQKRILPFEKLTHQIDEHLNKYQKN